MKKIDASQIARIKLAAEKKFGAKILYPKDCQALAISIENDTSRYISSTTLKRIWNIIKSKYNPSKYSLDTLAVYCGYNDWGNFVSQAVKQGIESDMVQWQAIIKNKAGQITESSLQSIKNKIGIPYKQTISREFSEKVLDEFLRNDKMATAFIGSAGCGKSIIVLHLVHKFFLNENAPCKDDILLLLDGYALANILNEKYRLLDWITDTLDFDGNRKDFKSLLQIISSKNQKFILLIDSIKQLSTLKQSLYNLIDDINRIVQLNDYNETIKVIITCRTELWSLVSTKINQQPKLTKKWYNVNFDDQYLNISNIPGLSPVEMKAIIKKYDAQINLTKIKIKSNELYSLIKFPYFLHVFLSLKCPVKILSIIDLFDFFAKKSLLSGIFAEEKMKIIDEIFKVCDYGKKSDAVNRADVQSIKQYQAAYRELISQGIISEYPVHGKYLSLNYYVKFTNQLLYEFVLINYWLRKYGLDYSLLEKVSVFYENNLSLHDNLLKWLIKFAFTESKTEMLKQIFTFIENISYIYPANDRQAKTFTLIAAISVELRKFKSLRKELLPHYAGIKQAQKLYFERFIDIDFLCTFFGDALDDYLNQKKTVQAQIHGHSLRFWAFFLNQNEKAARKEYSLLKHYENQIVLPYENVVYLINARIVYNYEYKGVLVRDFIMKIAHSCNNIRVLMSLIDTMSYCKQYEMITILYRILENYSDKEGIDMQVRFFKFSTLYYALALLHSGESKLALEIFHNTKIETFPVNSKYFAKIKYKIIQVEFMLFLNKYEKAERYIRYIGETAKALKFRWFESQAALLAERLSKMNRIGKAKKSALETGSE